MRYILAPSILSADFNVLGEQLRVLESLGVQYAHIDVMDGHFVPNISFGFPVIESIRRHSNLIFDVHLMISEPARYLERVCRAGADIVNFHMEAVDEPEVILNSIKRLSKRAAVTVNPCTPVETVFPYLGDVSMVLIMSVEPGFGGQRFMPEALVKAAKLRKYIEDNGFDVDIEMDGGICLDNLDAVLESGVNIVVAGSSVFGGSDIGMAISEFDKKFREYVK